MEKIKRCCGNCVNSRDFANAPDFPHCCCVVSPLFKEHWKTDGENCRKFKAKLNFKYKENT